MASFGLDNRRSSNFETWSTRLMIPLMWKEACGSEMACPFSIPMGIGLFEEHC